MVASPCDQDADWRPVERTLGDTAQQQVPDPAGAPCPDDEQLRATRGDGIEEFAQRFAVDVSRPRLPAGACA